MKGRGKLSVSMNDLNDNEFMDNQTSHYGGSKVRAYSKDLRVKKLEERNTKLQQEVIKIEKALAHAEEKTHYGVRLPEIKGDVIRKELQNAYKMVKQYEYEVNKRKRLESQQSFVEQLRKLQRVLKEKQQLSEKLRKQIMETKKHSIDMVRLLKDDTLKKQYEQKEVKINADIKWLHEKLKRIEAKRTNLNNNLERQQTQIQKIERQLTGKYEYEKSAIQNIRNKIINGTANVHNTTHISKQDEYDSDQQLEPPEERDDLFLYDRTPQTYNLLMNEVKLYRKLEKDYEGKIETVTREKEEAEDRNFKSRNRLVEIQYQMEKIESTIADLKKQVNPKALIPTKMDMIVEEKRRQSSSVKINKPKLTMAHSFKFNQVGEATKAGKRFIDRTAIGKRPAKIIGATFYQKKDGQNELMGLQAIYMVGSMRKKGNLNVLADISTLEAKQCSLQAGDFVKTIDCMTNNKGVIVGISMVSASNTVLKGGAMTANRKPIQMEQDEYPVCLHGCLLPDGIEMFGCEMVREE